MEICFAIFANVLELDDDGEPINEKYVQRRAATWLYKYCTGELPPGQPDRATRSHPPQVEASNRVMGFIVMSGRRRRLPGPGAPPRRRQW